jgi:aspartyl/asparaginyl beta-hydroxylase (cupin superfamily)
MMSPGSMLIPLVFQHFSSALIRKSEKNSNSLEHIAILSLIQGAPHVPCNSPPVQGLPPGWKEIKLIHEFEPVERNRTLAPTMSAIADQILAEYKVVAQFTILALEPGTELPVHADMANFLVSCHMGIEVPRECGLQVGAEKRSWLEGKCIAFNNSYLHSAFNHSSRMRYTLVVHTLHPNTTLTERKALALIVSTLKSMSVQSAP